MSKEVSSVHIKDLGIIHYEKISLAMRNFTHHRTPNTPDEIWVLEHFPVFTLGQQGKSEHILDQGDIPVIHTDRGGQVTYHGPGQIVVYPLINIQQKHLGIRQWVTLLENVLIVLLRDYNILAYGRKDAPGVYVDEAKIGSIGLRVRKGCSYHGLALNVQMDLMPFQRINPCGMQGLKMTQLADYAKMLSLNKVKQQLIKHLCQALGYNAAN